MTDKETIRVFVGTAANHEDAESQAVLEWSIRARCSMPVDITWMKLSREADSPFYSAGVKGWQTRQWATPFSGFRWALPFLCGYEGKAIYMDSDVIVMRDLAELWNQKFKPGKVVIAKGGAASWRFCVSLWDCLAAGQHLPSFEKLKSDAYSHKKCSALFSRNKKIVQPFVGNWNCLDGEKYDHLTDVEICAIHYTAMRHQPQLKYAIPRLARAGKNHWFDGEPAPHFRKGVQTLFDSALISAEASGYGVAKYCQDAEFGEYTKLKVGGVGKPSWV